NNISDQTSNSKITGINIIVHNTQGINVITKLQLWLDSCAET
ncbi:8689_t:CDS:1, partial [Scutellospora calospora]